MLFLAAFAAFEVRCAYYLDKNIMIEYFILTYIFYINAIVSRYSN